MKLIDPVLELGQLVASATGEREEIKREDDNVLLNSFAQGEGVAPRARYGDLGSQLTYG
jgi:hypothetical protein